MSSSITRDPLLLFFREFERDIFFKNDRHLLRPVRPLYRRLRGKPQVTGFSVWFNLLVTALRKAGHEVEINNIRMARRRRDEPVGLVGYPSLLDDWRLPNPAVLGPALFDHPAQAPNLMERPNFQTYLVTCDWMHDIFAPVYGPERLGMWFAGIDLDQWPDTRANTKDVDVLVYDKVRWHRDERSADLIGPVMAAIDRRGLSSEVIRYGDYTYAQYRRALARSRMMVFLCEHETQGMAYQEALASNLPVLAWDQGEWLDPARPRYSDAPVAATSVPYFSEACGLRFKGGHDFDAALDEVLDRLGSFHPRAFVDEHLSQARSADAYLSTMNQVCR